ncbi:MAG: MarR family transcriptional regulator [Candidatus Bathyarchaeia archaeon]|jgi:DNA-binding MarR family transcriptional regulator
MEISASILYDYSCIWKNRPQIQSDLAEQLGVEPYAMSRLLTKLEHSRYVTRTREATDKIVSQRKQE